MVYIQFLKNVKVVCMHKELQLLECSFRVLVYMALMPSFPPQVYLSKAISHAHALNLLHGYSFHWKISLCEPCNQISVHEALSYREVTISSPMPPWFSLQEPLRKPICGGQARRLLDTPFPGPLMVGKQCTEITHLLFPDSVAQVGQGELSLKIPF